MNGQSGWQTVQAGEMMTDLLGHREHSLHAGNRAILVLVALDMLQDLSNKLRILDGAVPHRAR